MRRAIIALGLASTIVLAGCSSSGGGDAAAPVSTPPPASVAPTDIVAVAAGNPNLSTLVAAVKAADLVPTLQGAGPFTVFAPTNEAFAALPAGIVNDLLLPCNKEALTLILTYHVLAKKLTAAEITPSDELTVEGQNIALTTDGGVTINDASKVVTADVPVSNGVVHIIDKVLVPPIIQTSDIKKSC